MLIRLVRRYFFSWVAISLFGYMSALSADDSPPSGNPAIVVAGIHFPPLSMVGDTASISGPAVDFLNPILGKLNRSYHWIGLPQNRLYRAIEFGHIDLTVSTKKHSELDEPLLFSEQVIGCLDVAILSSPYAVPLRSMNDLQHKRLLVFDYFEVEDLMPALAAIPGIRIDFTSRRSSAMVMLKMARTDYYLDFALPAKVAMENAGVRYEASIINKEPVYLAAPKNKPGAQELIEALDQLIASQQVRYTPAGSTELSSKHDLSGSVNPEHLKLCAPQRTPPKEPQQLAQSETNDDQR